MVINTLTGGYGMPKVIKKVETKPAVKQPAAVKRTGSKKYLTKVPEMTVFWCHDGQIFDDLEHLMAGFDRMSEETYMYHANEDKNDFSCWIIDVIGDVELAQTIKKAKNKVEAKKITQQRYAELTQLEG
jgi:hypothetical protein